ncbi:porin, partial [Staphylococcus aureus]|uniref:porin n=1 Tax=Staphylococcus aureus TaxID=1280 RepID=UPI0038B321FC
VPGTSTCIRVSGSVRAEADAGAGQLGSGSAPPRIDTRVDLDTRSKTDYGPVRTFLRAGSGRR